jgi:AraC-like DNA-binding protein
MARRLDITSTPGVLRTPPADRWGLVQWAPRTALEPYVDWHWAVVWDLRDHPPHRQMTLPYPCSHLVVEEGEARLYGPPRERFERTLAGRGRVVATRFAPGAQRPLLGRPVSSVAGRVLPASVLPGLDAAALVRAVEAEPDLDAAVECLEQAVAPLLPAAPAPAVALAGRAVALLECDRSLTRVPQLADRLELSVRSVQRLFAEYVGLGPAWVIRRFRLQDAATLATSGAEVDWARLAADLGYYDQAHLVRDFTAAVGTPPARYAAGGA